MSGLLSYRVLIKQQTAESKNQGCLFAISRSLSSAPSPLPSQISSVLFRLVLHLFHSFFILHYRSRSIAYAAMADVIHEPVIVPDPTQIDVKLFNRWSFDDIKVLILSIFFPSQKFPFLFHTVMCWSSNLCNNAHIKFHSILPISKMHKSYHIGSGLGLRTKFIYLTTIPV